jgi:hypothetical protein
LKNSIWTQKYFNKEPEAVLYWLFTCEDDLLTKFPKPISREKKILKLMYKDERRQEAKNMDKENAIQKIKQARIRARRSTIIN